MYNKVCKDGCGYKWKCTDEADCHSQSIKDMCYCPNCWVRNRNATLEMVRDVRNICYKSISDKELISLLL